MIGLSGRKLGYSTPLNFNNPYSATNLKEFWSRWHISLSSWLRDYLYFPLGGNRRGAIRTYVNVIITMTVGGLWHGAGWNFLVWGGFHGVGIAATHLFRDVRRKYAGQADYRAVQRSWAGDLFSWVSTFLFVSVGWVFFRSRNIGDALAILHRIIEFNVTAGNFPHHTTPITLCVIALVLLQDACRVKVIAGASRFLNGLPLMFEVATVGVFLSFLLRLAPDGVPEFIYYHF